MKARFYFVFICTIACSILLFASILFESGCCKNPSNSEETETGMVIDIDGNVYQTIQIGEQEWMAENLKVTRYRNGEKIANAKEDIEWNDLETGAWCDFVNNSDLAEIYGHLYNWYAVKDPRGLAPVGWRVPTDEDWKELEEYLGMSEMELDSIGLRGSGEGNSLKSDSGWNEN